MNHPYALTDPSGVASPALLFYPALIQRNIDTVIRMAGGPHRLRPHVKTHKCPQIVALQLVVGVTKHKCATIAEAEMLAQCGVPDVLLAYPLVGPNVQRFAQLTAAYPGTHFAATVDHVEAVDALNEALGEVDTKAGAFIDVNVGQDRTGTALANVFALARRVHESKSLIPAGLHVYDGHHTMPDAAARNAAVNDRLAPVLELRASLKRDGVPLSTLVCGGTPSFPVYAALQSIPDLECSPGTYVLHDAGYGVKYADLAELRPAAALFTRIVSKPTANRLTFDLGTKAVASDPPAGQRITLLDFPDYTPVGHNEEHFIIECPEAARFHPGDMAYALPTHICPTVALHKEALIVEEGKVVDRWPIVARDRMLTI